MEKRKKPASTKVQTGLASYSLSNLHQNASATLREESSGKKQNIVSAKSMLKLDHIKNLAVWASGDGSIPSLGAFFGNLLAASAEALNVSPDANLFTCQRLTNTCPFLFQCITSVYFLISEANSVRFVFICISESKIFYVYSCVFGEEVHMKIKSLRLHLHMMSFSISHF